MSIENENKNYWKEILLILVGGLLASIPILISTRMQTKAQFHQFIIDRQISALKDYSLSYHKLSAEIFMSAEKFEGNIQKYEYEYQKGQIDKDRISENLKTDLYTLETRIQNWISEVNAQIIVINALFKENFPFIPVSTFDAIEDSTFQLENIPLEQSFKDIKDALVRIKKNSVELTNRHQNIFKDLENKIERY